MLKNGEGLFDRHREDGEVLNTMLAVVDELKQLAAKARAQGDEANARVSHHEI